METYQLAIPPLRMSPFMQDDLLRSIHKSAHEQPKPLAITTTLPIWHHKDGAYQVNDSIIQNEQFINQIQKSIQKNHYAFIRQSYPSLSADSPINLQLYEKFMQTLMQDDTNTDSPLIDYGPKTGDFCVLDRPLYPGTKHIYKTGIDTLNLSRQHNELGYGDIWPKYISFLCITPPITGQGITTLSCGSTIAQTLQNQAPNLFHKLQKYGVRYIQMYLSDATKRHECHTQGPEDYCHVAPTWRHAFGTKSLAHAVTRCKNEGGWDQVEIIENDNIVVSRVRPVFLEIDHTTTFFNALVGFSKRPFRKVTLGNGDPFLPEELDLIETIQQNHMIGIPYQKGDILIVDNEKMMHGRSVRDMTKPREIAVTKGGIRKRTLYV